MRLFPVLLCAALLLAGLKSPAEEMSSRVFRLPSEFGLDREVPDDPFASPEAEPAANAAVSGPEAMARLGVTLPPGASASVSNGRLLVKTTAAQLDEIEEQLGVTYESRVVPEVRVRVVTFAVGEEFLLRAVTAPVGDGTALFQQLTDELERGGAELAGDVENIIRSGQRSKIEGIVEQPYPTEFAIDPPHAWPQSFEFRNLGTTLECEANVGKDGQSIDLNLAPESCRFRGFERLIFPAIKSGKTAPGMIEQPVMLTERLTTQALCRPGRPVLLAISRPADTGSEHPGGKAQRSLATFVVATFLNAQPTGKAEENVPQQTRLHVVGFRMGSPDARELLSVRSQDDNQLFDHCFAKAKSGTASLAGHLACLCRNGQRARVDATTEYPRLSDRDPSLEFRTLGESLEWECSGDEKTISMNVMLSRSGEPLRGLLTDGKGIEIGTSLLAASDCNAEATVRPGEWRLLAVTAAEGEDGEKDAEVWFAMGRMDEAGKPAPPVRDSLRGRLVSAAVYSLSEEAAAELASETPEAAAARLEVAAENDDCRLIGVTASAASPMAGTSTASGHERMVPAANGIFYVEEQMKLSVTQLLPRAGEDTDRKAGSKQTALSLRWPSAPTSGPTLAEVVGAWQKPVATLAGIPPRVWRIDRPADDELPNPQQFAPSGPLEATFINLVGDTVLFRTSDRRSVISQMGWLMEDDRKLITDFVAERQAHNLRTNLQKADMAGIIEYMEEVTFDELPPEDGVARLAAAVSVKAPGGSAEHGRVHAVVLRRR